MNVDQSGATTYNGSRSPRKRHCDDRQFSLALWDIALGVTCGLALTGLAASAGIDTPNGAASTTDALAASGNSAPRASYVQNGKMISIRVTTVGSMMQAIMGGTYSKVTMPEGSTVANLADHLADVHPALGASAMLAIDNTSGMMPLDSVLVDGQTVELVGAMAGG